MIVTIMENGKWGSKKVQFISGKSWYMTPVPELKDSPLLNVGKRVDITTEEKENSKGTKNTFIATVKEIEEVEKVEKVEKVKEEPINRVLPAQKDDKPTPAYWEKKDAKFQDGQARGNYRNNITNYLIGCLNADVVPDVYEFNKLLKLGEVDYFQVLATVTSTDDTNQKPDKKPDPYTNL